VGDIIAEVTLRRWIDWGQPHCCYAEPFKIIEPLQEPLEIATTIAVRILKRYWRNLVDHAAPPPSLFRRKSPIVLIKKHLSQPINAGANAASRTMFRIIDPAETLSLTKSLHPRNQARKPLSIS